MFKNNYERQRDIALGDAILELLNENAAVTSAALLEKLQFLLSEAEEGYRKEAIISAIQEVVAS